MKFAICNELFEGWSFADVARKSAELGYTGLELAPFTLGALASHVTPAQRKQLRQEASDAGVEIIGLHWLLAKVEGFHINSPDAAVQQRTADYLAELVHLCGDLGGSLMVFGSPGARKVLDGVATDDAYHYAAETLSKITGALDERGVAFCLEPLSTMETNFLNTADEAERLRQMIGHSRIQIHLDVKAMSSETMPIPEIIEKHQKHLGHFHANDPNMRGPGMGEVDFVPIFAALERIDYQGWVSVEVFDFKPDPVTIATDSIQYMKRVLEQASAGMRP